MKYNLLHTDHDQDLITRLMHIRNIQDNLDSFLNPSYQTYRQDPASFNDMAVALDRIDHAIQQGEKIMIFGDYDVDGIMSSYIMYTFFTKFIGYKDISIRLPHRTKDGYGIKTKHIDDIHEQGCSLIITVDNGTTSFEEVAYAKTLGIDMIITDHHKPLDQLPTAAAIVNPHLTEDLGFKEICGAAVALKVCMALAEKHNFTKEQKKAAYERLLPFASIATVADCMPLIDENRLLVKKGLELMNAKRHRLAPSLRQRLDYLNIKKMDTYHIGFQIGPRLNATGRMDDAMQGLQSLLISHPGKQRHQLEKIETMNAQRRTMQQQMSTEAKSLIDTDNLLLVAKSENFHEGIVGIVAGRLTEQHNKPSLVLRIDSYKKTATGSLRGPSYFNVVDMLKTADDLLLRYGGHAQAGGMSVDLADLDEVLERFYAYCETRIDDTSLEKVMDVDTLLHTHELNDATMDQVLQFGPYGQANPEPLFLLEETVIMRAEEVGRGEKTHLKLHCQKDDRPFHIMQRGKGDTIGEIERNVAQNIIGKVKADTFNGGFYVEGKWIG